MRKAIEKALLLQDLDVVRFATADHLMLLAEAGGELLFKKGDAIFRAGDPASTFYILVLGRAAIVGADECVVEKAALNLRACLTNAALSSGCVCLEDCTVLAYETSCLFDLLAGEPELTLALLKYFAADAAHLPVQKDSSRENA